MRSSLLVVAVFGLIIVAWGCQIKNGAPSSVVNNRIYNGTDAAPGELPFLACIYAGSYRCGAIVIDDRHLLTAAHCIPKLDMKVTVKLGCHNLTECDDEREAEKYLIHPMYNTLFWAGFDIGLIRMKETIRFSNQSGKGAIEAIKLPEGPVKEEDEVLDMDFKLGDTLTVAGWGFTKKLAEEKYEQTDVPKKVNVTTKNCCDYNLGPWTIYWNVCAGSGMGTTCDGDSGGPLFRFDEATKSSTLIGIVSAGSGDCTGIPSSGSIYTRVAYFLDWIENTKRELSREVE